MTTIQWDLNRLKNDLLRENPFSMIVENDFQDMDFNTQASVFMQKEINITDIMDTTNNKFNETLVTNRFHNQKNTLLCASISTISCLRSAAGRYLKSILKARGVDERDFMNDMNLSGQYSFNKMLTIFTSCVSLRSLDGLIINSKNKIIPR